MRSIEDATEEKPPRLTDEASSLSNSRPVSPWLSSTTCIEDGPGVAPTCILSTEMPTGIFASYMPVTGVCTSSAFVVQWVDNNQIKRQAAKHNNYPSSETLGTRHSWEEYYQKGGPENALRTCVYPRTVESQGKSDKERLACIKYYEAKSRQLALALSLPLYPSRLPRR